MADVEKAKEWAVRVVVRGVKPLTRREARAGVEKLLLAGGKSDTISAFNVTNADKP